MAPCDSWGCSMWFPLFDSVWHFLHIYKEAVLQDSSPVQSSLSTCHYRLQVPATSLVYSQVHRRTVTDRSTLYGVLYFLHNTHLLPHHLSNHCHCHHTLLVCPPDYGYWGSWSSSQTFWGMQWWFSYKTLSNVSPLEHPCIPVNDSLAFVTE